MNLAEAITRRAYLEAAGCADDMGGAPFGRVRINRSGDFAQPLHPESVHQSVVRHYSWRAGIETGGAGSHSFRATVATNALLNGVVSPRFEPDSGTPASAASASVTSENPARR